MLDQFTSSSINPLIQFIYIQSQIVQINLISLNIDYIQIFIISSMLLSSKHTVKLAKKYQKILFLSTALKDTFVFLGMPGIGRDCIVHCDQNGKILFQRQFQKNVDSFGMLSQRQVIVLQTRDNRITVLDLQTHKFSYFNHQFVRQDSDLSDIETFNQSRLLCIKEQGQYNDPRFILTYYAYPLLPDSKPIAVYESQDDQWTHQYISRKANNHSMIAWFKPRNDQQIQIKTYDLRDDPKGKYRQFKIRNTIGEPYNLNRVEMAISNLWENTKDILCLVCISNKTDSKALNKEGVTNNNFTVDLNALTIRETKYWFDKKYNDYLIDYLYLGPIAMFRTFFFVDGKVESSPVYYVNNQTEQIVAEEKWECTYKTKYYVPGFDNSTLIEAEYQNGDVQEFTVMTKKILDPKQIALHFLLHMNQDFDDDLLQDAIELLDSNG